MSQFDYQPGAVLVCDNGTYTKVISEKNGVYGISGWAGKRSAEKANVARKFINGHGLKYAGARIVSEGEIVEEKADAPADSSGEHEYTRTQLRDMKVDKLYPLAESVGVSTDGKNKSDVLDQLFDHFGL